MKAKQFVRVSGFNNEILVPGKDMEYVMKDGGHIIANTAPGCWGSMITPASRGGHEVTKPVYVEGAEVVEEGSFQELINKQGLYYEMYTSQSKWYQDEELEVEVI